MRSSTRGRWLGMLPSHARDNSARPVGGDRPAGCLRAPERGGIHRPVHLLVPSPLVADGQATETSSTSMTMVVLGGTAAEALPAAPNTSAGGRTSLGIPPTRTPATPTLQNARLCESPSASELGVCPAPRVVITRVPF